MTDIVKKKLVPAGKLQKTNWYYSRQRGGYPKINKKHSLLGFEVDPKNKIYLRMHPEYSKWSYSTRTNFSEWTITYPAPQKKSMGLADLDMSLCFTRS